MQEERRLRGQRQIMRYEGRSWRKIMELYRKHHYPISRIGGRWETTTAMVDAWRDRRMHLEVGK